MLVNGLKIPLVSFAYSNFLNCSLQLSHEGQPHNTTGNLELCQGEGDLGWRQGKAPQGMGTPRGCQSSRGDRWGFGQGLGLDSVGPFQLRIIYELTYRMNFLALVA